MAMAPPEMDAAAVVRRRAMSCDSNVVGSGNHHREAEAAAAAEEDDPAAAVARKGDLQQLIYGQWDDEDEEDDDWIPPAARAAAAAYEDHAEWLCVNCTICNLEESSHCRLCGEHRQSGILIQGHLASPLVPAEAGETITGEFVSSKKTAVGYDNRMLLHSEVHMRSNPHPERPDRLRAIVAGFKAAGLYPGSCVLIPVREITRAELEKVHTHEHVDIVENTAKLESCYFTSDTYANPNSALAARLAAGICADLASAILSGQVDNGFALVRPPGHHAEDATVMGFCLHNNACIAAKAAQAAGAKKVLIVDWDVHHGNGTQEIFEQDPSVLYISLHRHEGGRFYPGTGSAREVGSGPGEGFSVNIPWPCSGIGDIDYIAAVEHVVLPIARQFAPDITIISAGFDAAKGDPLGGCQVTPAGYAQMTQMLSSISSGKLLVVLEGGYNLRSISASATAVLKVLSGESPEALKEGEVQPTRDGVAALLEVFVVQSRYWSALDPPSFLKLTTQHMNTVAGVKKPTEPLKKPTELGLKPTKGLKLKRKRLVFPMWRKLGRRSLMYKHWFRVRSSHSG